MNIYCYDDSDLRRLAEAFEELKIHMLRKEFAEARAKVRRLIVEVIGGEAHWKKFAAEVKQDNVRRPAFQQEFAGVLPGWRKLN